MTDAPVEERDIDAIQSHDWPERELGAISGFRDNGFQVVFRQSVLDDIHLHGQSATDIEICGVLIGSGYQDAHGPYLRVEHSIRGDNARGQSTNVTFTAETWQHIQETMDRLYPDKKIIGWYHSHPGFGIFLSDMDVFICDNFFNLPWQVAFVYDPLGGDEGNFVWRAGKPKREAMLIEDDVTAQAAAIPLISVAAASSGTAISNDKVIELFIRVRQLERRQKFLFVSVAFLATFFAMWAYFYVPITQAMKSTTQPSTTMPSQPAIQPAPILPESTTQPML